VKTSASPWFERRAYRPSTGVPLYCFPYAGGSDTLFRGWEQWLAGVADICAVRLPGRAQRLHEPAMTSVAAVVDALLAEGLPAGDRRFALFGYSMGAILGFELARALQHRGAAPRALIVAAAPAPHLPRRDGPTWHLPDDQFRRHLRDIEGTPAELLSNDDAMALFLPTLRADFQLIESYRYASGRPLTCPIFAFHGEHDRHVSRDEMAQWAQHTTRPLVLESLAGDHFFVRTSLPRMLRSLERVLLHLP
jgi:medium-chain acyl-[acyl-carrier-protein] hydrolase